MPGRTRTDPVTWTLVGLSTALLQVAIDNRQAGAGVSLLVFSIALAIALRLTIPGKNLRSWSALSVTAVTVLGLVPFVWDILSRSLMATGDPLEVQLTYAARNMMIALAAVGHMPRARGLATLTSLFLVVCGFLWATNAWTIGLLIVYTLVGMWWLVGSYWERLGGRFADETVPSAPIRPALLAVLTTVLLVMAAAPLALRSRTTTALEGFFPSSGGTRLHDPFAYGGVGDGDQMVAAKDDASSFGPVESELFLESKMPSLYDTLNEFSQEPPKKNKRARRAIPLAASSTKENHQKKATTQKASREFSTVRQLTKRRSRADDRLSQALLLVSGRTPMHLALETFDHWDGHSLIAAESSEKLRRRLEVADANGDRWLDLSPPLPDDLFTASTKTQVRIINLRTASVPTPPNTTALTIDQLHTASMFKLASDGSLAMNLEMIPQLTILHMRSALRDQFCQPPLVTTPAMIVSPQISRIAAEWTAGVERGWPQVNAILEHLRTEYAHDPQAMIPASVDDAVEHFLVQAKRGPDYIFAASAAVLLRSLGYETRVRSGFYASPERYNRVSRLTSVLPEDVHFWVEVRSSQGFDYMPNGKARRGVWITLEPTPGFELLYAPQPVLATMQRWAWSVLYAMASHPFYSLLSCLTVSVLFTKRRSLLDAILMGIWSVVAPFKKSRDLPRFTLRLVECRAWVHGRSRPAGTPLGRWDALVGRQDFLTAASWALYGERTAAPLSPTTLHDACRQVTRATFK